jgi:hypothetical protein
MSRLFIILAIIVKKSLCIAYFDLNSPIYGYGLISEVGAVYILTTA